VYQSVYSKRSGVTSFNVQVKNGPAGDLNGDVKLIEWVRQTTPDRFDVSFLPRPAPEKSGRLLRHR
jgi:hypothetical protein